MKAPKMAVARVYAIPMRELSSSISRRGCLACWSSTERVVRRWNFSGNSLAVAVASSAGRVLMKQPACRDREDVAIGVE